MNIDENLLLLSNLLSIKRTLYIWKYTPSMQLISTNCPRKTLFSSVFHLSDCSPSVIKHYEESNFPLVLNDPFGMVWICVYEEVKDELEAIHLIGPAFTTEITQKNLESKLEKHKISLKYKRILVECMEEIPVIPITTYFEYGLMLHFCVTNKRLSFSDLSYQQNETLKTPISSASSNSNNSDHVGVWSAEQLLIKMVEDGNINYNDIKNNIRSLSFGVKIAVGDPLRQAKDSVIVFTALCTRAAIRGGLSSQLAYNLNDYYVQSIEQCESITELSNISHDMYDDFINRVHKIKMAPDISNTIRNCCDYIMLHIYDELDLPTLAKQTGYSNYYLSRRFKKEVGVSINEFIRNCKIEQAKLLLITTTENITEISLKLSFSSRNYFSDIFQKLVGMTPKEFREQNKR